MIRRVIAIGAHPDDIEIGCGGTIRLFADRGYDVKFVVVTSGEEGAIASEERLTERREIEAKASAKILGASDVFFMREPDGLTSFSKQTRMNLIKIIRDFRPDIALIHSQSDQFSDHKLVHELSVSAIQLASGPWYPDAGSFPHAVTDVFGFEVWNPIPAPQLSVDITDAMDQKLEALSCHKTQTSNLDYLGFVRGLNAYRAASTMTGMSAESFEVIKIGLRL